MKIAVAGLGYVGFANAVLLAQRHDVVAVDVDPTRVAAVQLLDLRTPDMVASDQFPYAG